MKSTSGLEATAAAAGAADRVALAPLAVKPVHPWVSGPVSLVTAAQVVTEATGLEVAEAPVGFL
jgi:hypothetical protein